MHKKLLQFMITKSTKTQANPVSNASFMFAQNIKLTCIKSHEIQYA